MNGALVVYSILKARKILVQSSLSHMLLSSITSIGVGCCTKYAPNMLQNVKRGSFRQLQRLTDSS